MSRTLLGKLIVPFAGLLLTGGAVQSLHADSGKPAAVRWWGQAMVSIETYWNLTIIIDPVLAAIDLNPQQMPPDYVAAHPDWTGAEEARQMERVTAFTRRFASLPDDLDAKAPGSRWTPRGLINQMEDHDSEHTANVVKKFDLPEFPQE